MAWWLGLVACGAPPVARLDGRLPPCPATPNCVSSEPGTDADHAVSALPLPGDRPLYEVLDALEALVRAQPRAEVVARDADGIRATFRTPTLRFVDDVSFRVSPTEGVVHLRSASRLGRGDLGVNRRRAEALRRAWVDGAAAGE